MIGVDYRKKWKKADWMLYLAKEKEENRYIIYNENRYIRIIINIDSSKSR